MKDVNTSELAERWLSEHGSSGWGAKIGPLKDLLDRAVEAARPVAQGPYRTCHSVGDIPCDQRDEYGRQCIHPSGHETPHAATADAASSWMRGYEGSMHAAVLASRTPASIAAAKAVIDQAEAKLFAPENVLGTLDALREEIVMRNERIAALETQLSAQATSDPIPALCFHCGNAATLKHGAHSYCPRCFPSEANRGVATNEAVAGCTHEWTHHCKKCGQPSELDGFTETERSSAIKAFTRISALVVHDSEIDQIASEEHSALVHFRGKDSDNPRFVEELKAIVKRWTVLDPSNDLGPVLFELRQLLSTAPRTDSPEASKEG